MSNLKRWRTLGGGEFHKWEKGESLEGTWQGTAPGKFGENGVLLVDGRLIRFSLSTALKDLIAVAKGTEVCITFLGKQIAKNGNSFNAFQIQVPEDYEPTADEADSDVPF